MSIAADGHRWLLALAAPTKHQLRIRLAEACGRLGDRTEAEFEESRSKRGDARIIAMGSNLDEVKAGLASFLAAGRSPAVRTGTGTSRLAFVFAGQSETRPGMGAALYATNSVFADAVDKCSIAVERVLARSLSAAIYEDLDEAVMHDARLAQPALLALQTGLAALWRHWGVTPDAASGHSLGEYAAACCAGIMAPEDAMGLVAQRGRITHECARPGAMAVVFANEDVVAARLASHGRIALAAINAPDVVVVAGPKQDIADFIGSLKAADISAKALHISHAFHSWCVDPILDALEEAARKIAFRRSALLYASALEGRLLSEDERLDARYWRRHAREPVRFVDAARSLLDAGCTVFLELGPHATLTSVGERCSGEAAQWLPSLRRSGDDHVVLGEAAIELWLSGIDVNLQTVARELGWEWLHLHDYVSG